MSLPNIVIATNRPEQLKKMLCAWNNFFSGCVLHVVFDLDEIPEDFKVPTYSYTVNCYSRKEINADLGKVSWIIPQNSSAIKSYGIYKAWQNNPLFIYILDDDVLPPIDGSDPVKEMYKKLFYPIIAPKNNWLSTTKGFLPRGTRNTFRNISVVHGMWENVPDFSAETQATTTMLRSTSRREYNEFVVPAGVFISLCGMNLAFKPGVAKWMYFGLQGKIRREGKVLSMPTSRTDDILAGIYVKHKLDSVGQGMYSGAPHCWHTRASNTWRNLELEVNDEEIIDEFESVFINDFPPTRFEEYFTLLKEAYTVWGELFGVESN